MTIFPSGLLAIPTETVEGLQTDLDAWLVPYNRKGPHLGFRD